MVFFPRIARLALSAILLVGCCAVGFATPVTVTATITGIFADGQSVGDPFMRVIDGDGSGNSISFQQNGDNSIIIQFLGNSVSDQPVGENFVLGTLSVANNYIAATPQRQHRESLR